MSPPGACPVSPVPVRSLSGQSSVQRRRPVPVRSVVLSWSRVRPASIALALSLPAALVRVRVRARAFAVCVRARARNRGGWANGRMGRLRTYVYASGLAGGRVYGLFPRCARVQVTRFLENVPKDLLFVLRAQVTPSSPCRRTFPM